MPRFFLPQDHFDGSGCIEISGTDARHISKSLRMSAGDTVVVCDMRRYEYICRITEITGETVRLKIEHSEPSENEPDVRVTLYQAFVKGDKMDNIVQKAVELGVSEIVPVMTDRAVSRPDTGSMDKKVQRWQKISDEAAGQCGRGCIIRIREPIDYRAAVSEVSSADMGFICYEGDGTIPVKPFFESFSGRKIVTAAFIIGPEGGLSERETEIAKTTDIPMIGLGKRILRTETASGCVLAALMYATGNL